MRNGETERAIRTLLLDVLEQCARHMDAAPHNRAQFKPIAHAVHVALEDFERQFLKRPELIDEEQALRMVSRAQEMSLEWLHTMQEIRSEPLLTDHLETWPNSSVLAGTRITGWQP